MFRQPEDNPLTSIAIVMWSSPKDYSLDYRDAWMYGVAVGCGEAIDEVCTKHNWNTQEKERLLHLHEKYLQLEDECQNTTNV